MSIIHETLNRLEMEGPGPKDHLYTTGLSRPPRKSTGFPVKVLATVMLVVFAGTGLVVWQWNGRPGGSTEWAPTEADRQSLPGGRPDHWLSPVSIEDQAFPNPQSTVQNGTTATPADPPVSSVPRPAPLVPETGKQHRQANGSSQRAQSGEGLSALAGVRPGAVKIQTEKSKSAPAVSNKQRQTAATQRAVSSVPRPAEKVSRTSKQHMRANRSSPQVRSGENHLAVASTMPAIVKAPSEKFTSAPAASNKQQQTAAVVASSDSGQPSAVDEAVDRARVALSRGQYQQALAALEKLSPVPERRADFWLMKGSAHLALRQLEPAEKALAAAQLLAPDSADVAVQRAILEQEKGDNASALQILKDAATRHPDVPEVFLNEGYSQQELGAMQDAARSYRVFLSMTEGRSLYAAQRKAVHQWLAQFLSASD